MGKTNGETNKDIILNEAKKNIKISLCLKIIKKIIKKNLKKYD